MFICCTFSSACCQSFWIIKVLIAFCLFPFTVSVSRCRIWNPSCQFLLGRDGVIARRPLGIPLLKFGRALPLCPQQHLGKTYLTFLNIEAWCEYVQRVYEFTVLYQTTVIKSRADLLIMWSDIPYLPFFILFSLPSSSSLPHLSLPK